MSQRAQRTHRGRSQAARPRGHLRRRPRPPDLGHHRVRVPDPRVQGPHQVRVRRAQRPLDLRVRRRARASSSRSSRRSGRAVADRRAAGIGGGPVVRKAAFAGAVLTGVADRAHARSASPRSAAHRPAVPRAGGAARLLRDRARHLRGAAHHARHALGQRALRPLRHDPRRRGHVPDPAGASCSTSPGIDDLVWYGLALAIPPVLAALVVGLRGQHGLIEPGPRRRVVGALDQPHAAVPRVARRAGAELLGRARRARARARARSSATTAADFIVGFFIARIPILLFQAIQAALLPKLAALVGRGQARRLPLRAQEAGA